MIERDLSYFAQGTDAQVLPALSNGTWTEQKGTASITLEFDSAQKTVSGTISVSSLTKTLPLKGQYNPEISGNNAYAITFGCTDSMFIPSIEDIREFQVVWSGHIFYGETASVLMVTWLAQKQPDYTSLDQSYSSFGQLELWRDLQAPDANQKGGRE